MTRHLKTFSVTAGSLYIYMRFCFIQRFICHNCHLGSLLVNLLVFCEVVVLTLLCVGGAPCCRRGKHNALFLSIRLLPSV